LEFVGIRPTLVKRIEMIAELRWVGVGDAAAHLSESKDSVYRWIEKMG